MLKLLFLLTSLIGLSLSSVPDPVPPPAAIGGKGEFIRDPVRASGASHIVHDVVPSSGVIVNDIVTGPRASAIVHDVAPGPRSNAIVHDVVPGPRSNAIVHDVVPGPRSNAIVHDLVPGPRSNAIVHDVVPASHTIVHDIPGARSNAVVRDVVPRPNAIVRDVVSAQKTQIAAASSVVRDAVPAHRAVVPPGPRAAGVVHDAGPNSGNFASIPAVGFPHSDNGIGSSLVAPSARYVDPAHLKCGLKPEPFVAYQLSRFAYNYPRYEITNEIKNRPEIRQAVYALATHGRFSRRNVPIRNAPLHRGKREALRINGCVGEALTLRTFYAYNNYCWLVHPVYQDVTFYNCYQNCAYRAGYGTVNRCEAKYVYRKLLAYCAGLPYSKRIGYVTVPIPTSCSCRTYKCS